ncbi:MAG: CDP-alcohol phosphatidyltransferase family protein [Chloroflexi bacterium]|nr:CDP-alcohol phosphatidyltransferase family protein [Chloroflexota bacterium]
MLNEFRHFIGEKIAIPVVKLIAKTRITPNILTVTGFGFNVVVAMLLALLPQSYFYIAGLVLIFASVYDMLDGALARMTGKSSKFGAILDSTLDRYSEAVILLGLLIFYTDPFKFLPVVLIFISLIGSTMVSYVRARAEGLGLKNEVGLFTRPERIILLVIGLIISQTLIYVLWIMAIGTNITALWRLIHVWRTEKKQLK